LDLYAATGYEDLKGRKISTWNRQPNGLQTFAQMLKNSNNPCLAQTALEIDPAYYYSKLGEFGIGKLIGIGLQEETTFYLRPFSQWTK
jgi:stage V sporulation protein D (sporulation-specific penicillin-binding protein)